MLVAQCLQLRGAVQSPAGLERDVAQRQQPVEFAAREVVGHLVGSQAELVQATALGPRIEQAHLMAQLCQAYRAGQTRRAGADHRDALTGGRRAVQQVCQRAVHHRIHRMALQAPDLDRLALLGGANASLFAQFFGRADPGAGAAQRVGLQNRPCSTAQVVVGDASDEAGHINAGRAGGHAGCVEAVQAAFGLDQCLATGQSRCRIRKALGVLFGRQARRLDVGACRTRCNGVGC